MKSRPTQTIEDYLGVIYILERDGEPAIGSRLAEWMSVAPPTVTATVKRMLRDGWVTVDDKRSLHLTPSGREAAKSLLQRHMLSELLLTRVLGVPWSETHEEAHRMEHAISQSTLERLRDQFNDPDTCPHGNPIPGHEPVTKQWVPLTKAQANQQVTIKRVHESIEDNLKLMAYLEAHGVMPGVRARVREVMPFNQSLVLDVKGRPVVLGFAVAHLVFVAMSLSTTA